MIRRRFSRPVLALTILLGLCGGCIGLFEPDQPQAPLSNNCSPTLVGDYSSPTAILASISAAMKQKASGRCVYIQAFADSGRDGFPYKASFPAEIVQERERVNLPVPVWRRDQELIFYDDFMGLSDLSYTFEWLPYPEAGSDLGATADGDSTLHRRYLATPSGGAVALAAGTADLVFRRRNDGSWVLVGWRDQTDPSRPGDLAELLDQTISQRRLEAYDAAF